MKRTLLLTTAVCGFYWAMGTTNAEAITYATILTTVTTYSKDFPDSSASYSSYTTESRGRVCKSDSGDGTNSCFSYDTLIRMKDGSLKKIGDITAGDVTAYGEVHQTFIRRFDQTRMATRNFQSVYRGGLYNYNGILVTGNHVVRAGAHWIQVADAQGAVPVGIDETAHIGNVYNLDVEGGIIPVMNAAGELMAFLDDKQAIIFDKLAA